MQELVKKIKGIQQEVKRYIIHRYVNQCKLKHAIAFLEWRLHFSDMRRNNVSSVAMNDSELVEIIDGRMDLILQ